MKKTLSISLFLLLIVSCKPKDSQTVTPVKLQQFEIQEVVSAETEAERLQQSLPYSDFTATALYLPANTVLKMTVEQLKGKNLPKLLIGTYNRYKNEEPRVIDLLVGENTIKANQYGGLLYLRYNFKDNIDTQSKVKVTFREGFTKAPHYILGKTTDADWQKQLNEYTEAPDVIMESEHAMMVYSRKLALEWKDSNRDVVLKTVETIIDVEDKISGLDGSLAIHKRPVHKILMTENNDDNYYMFAWYYGTAYNGKSGAQFAFTERIISEGWGPWHELGHMHQQYSWTWDEVVEATVNIYSLAVERTLNSPPSSLTKGKIWTQMGDFFNIENRDFNNNLHANVFVRLCMFEQLRLAFGDEFYIKLHKRTRENPPKNLDNQGKMSYFMKQSCLISGKDLSAFFKKWGFNNLGETYQEIANMKLPQPIIDPSTLTH